MIIDSQNRRGYTITQRNAAELGESLDRGRFESGRLVIESFDLDSLRILHQMTVVGYAISGGYNADIGMGNDSEAGDIVHAVDPEAKRIYLPVARNDSTSQLHRRLVGYVLVLDEEQFDRDPGHAFGAFSFADEQFAGYKLMGLTMDPYHRDTAGNATLLGAFAAINPQNSGVYDHWLVGWRPAITTHQAPPSPAPDPTAFPPPVASSWAPQPLLPCATAPMWTPSGSNQVSWQWDILATPDATYLGCQGAPGNGGILKIPYDQGKPASAGAEQFVGLGKPIGDVLADPGAARLYVRSYGNGSTLWAFDAQSMRFAGSIAVYGLDGQGLAAGVDPISGRLYTLTTTTCQARPGGGWQAVEGGIHIDDARLDPVPAPQNLRPDMAYPVHYRIQVDPVARRFFVRRGTRSFGALEDTRKYPDCDHVFPAPIEHFWRVFQDNVPVASTPEEPDDSAFTTNVPEADGVTEASFLGSGTGYGARMLLTGGLTAPTGGMANSSPCGPTDREVIVGTVNGVEVSDQSTTAEAASIDADLATQRDLAKPLTQCRPQSSSYTKDATYDQCYGDSNELALDNAKSSSGGGCGERTGENAYEIHCLQDDGRRAAPGRNPAPTVPRDGFSASAACNAAQQEATASAQGELTSNEVSALQMNPSAPSGVPRDPLTVAHASSTVTVTRAMGKGVVVHVESVARGVLIPGVGSIGAVFTEATSTATGRDGRAKGEFHRRLCDVVVGGTLVSSGCLEDEDGQQAAVKQLNAAFNGRGEIRLRSPDESLRAGTRHGYLAAIQRDRKDLFGDQTLTKDRSLAVPGLEIISYIGDGGAWGAGRQVLQLAGAQASTSYGIACVNGQAPNGGCAGESIYTDSPFEQPFFGAPPSFFTDLPPSEPPLGIDVAQPQEKVSFVDRIKRIPQAIADALRLLFNNPRELGLLAAVWGLLYAPCYLGERRRSVNGLRSRRATARGV